MKQATRRISPYFPALGMFMLFAVAASAQTFAAGGNYGQLSQGAQYLFIFLRYVVGIFAVACLSATIFFIPRGFMACVSFAALTVFCTCIAAFAQPLVNQFYAP